MPIALRPVIEDDYTFLLSLYASTREQELASTDWNPAQREAFLRMQFDAQQAHYRSHYPGGEHWIILIDGAEVGRLYVSRGASEIRILDITITPERRNSGTGSSILKDLMAEAEETNKSLTIYVESFNPSLRLFERLGFSQTGEYGYSYLMEWRASNPQTD